MLPAHMQDYVARYSYPHLEIDGVRIVDCDDGKFMNHSERPNTDFHIFDRGHALVDIAAGEEITCSYFEFDPDFRASARRRSRWRSRPCRRKASGLERSRGPEAAPEPARFAKRPPHRLARPGEGPLRPALVVPLWVTEKPMPKHSVLTVRRLARPLLDRRHCSATLLACQRRAVRGSHDVDGESRTADLTMLAYGPLDPAQSPLFVLSCFSGMNIVVLDVHKEIPAQSRATRSPSSCPQPRRNRRSRARWERTRRPAPISARRATST